MKMNSTFKHALLALTIMVSVAACKKDKKDPEPTPPVEVKAITLTDLKALSTGASVKVPDGKKISGIVISDAGAKNIDSKTVILQEAADKPGIVITFDAAQTFVTGDQLEVNISNQTLAQVNGEVVLQNIPAANAKKTGTGSIAAKATTAADIATNKTTLDGTLVTLADGSFEGSDGKYKATLTFTDATGTVKSNVLTGAAFENTAYPASINQLTGIVRVNGTEVRVDIRNASDAVSGAVTRTITDDFSTFVVDPNNGNFTTTPVGAWEGGYTLYKTPYAADNFLQAGKNYLHIFTIGSTNLLDKQGSFGGSGVANPLFDPQSLKTITLTLAGSKLTEAIAPYPGAPDYLLTSSPFNPAQHTNRVQLSVKGIDGANDYYPVVEATFNDVGVFHTITFKFPEPTEEAYKAALLKCEDPYTPGVLTTEANASAYASRMIQGLNSGNFKFRFQFFRSSDRSADPNTETEMFIIEKAVLGFNK